MGFSNDMQLLSDLRHVDLTLFRVINQQWINPVLDRVMPFISDPQPFIPWLALGGLSLLIFGGFRGRLFILLMVLALVIGDAGINCTIKHAIHRPRPYQSMEGVRIVKREQITLSGPTTLAQDGESFTSGHACNNVALAFMACAVYGRSALLLWLWAILISYSRVYTGSHYPSDILGAWMIAPLYSWGIVTCLPSLWQKIWVQWFPKLYAHHPNLFPDSKERSPC